MYKLQILTYNEISFILQKQVVTKLNLFVQYNNLH